MAVGRITGPLLAKNLVRDGVDIAFETDLLYLDVTTGRIGIKTASPEYTLDVRGDASVTALRVETTSTLGNLKVYSTNTATFLDNTLGNVIIKAPVEQKILLKNDTVVSGNLHATGNITANGSVQIGNMTGSDTLSLYADIVSDITPQTPNQYNIGAPGKEWAEAYVNSIIASQIASMPGQDVNITPSPGGVVNINSNVRIWGGNPLGTGPVVSNVLYVSTDGSDTNDGRAADPSRACRTIGGALKSPYYKEGTSIKVAPGHYYENNPLELKPLTSVIGSDLRTTFVEPIHKTQDLFHVRSGCYIAQMQMTNGQSGLLPGTGYTAGTNRGAYAVAFPPNYGGTKIDLYYSPYIQNCTNQSGPWLLDGTMFVPNQTVQVPTGVGEATWELNTTTMLVTMEEGIVRVGDTINIGPSKPGFVNARTLMLANKSFFQEQVIAYIDQKYEFYGYNEDKCIRDTGLIIDSLISDLLFGGNGYTQSNFSGLQYWSQNGYTGQIPSEITATLATISFVNDVAQEVVQNITSGVRYQSTVTQQFGVGATSAESDLVNTEFTLILDIINNGTADVTDRIEPNGTSSVSIDRDNAATLLISNKEYIQAEAIAFVTANYATLEYDPAKCARDVGYMLDSIAFDIKYGGNRQAVQSGVYYYGFSDSSSVIASERPQTTAAYFRIRSIIEDIITNQYIEKSPGNLSVQDTSVTASTAATAVPLREMLDLIIEIINGGPEAAQAPTPISLTKNTTPAVLHAAEILDINRAFITSEVIGYIEYTYNNGYAYNQPKCARDTGLIVDSIATDLIYEGDTQSTFAGLQYWNQSDYTGLIRAELSSTIAAINYAADIAAEVVTNSTGTRYQSTVSQVFGLGGNITHYATVSNCFGIIANIVQNGTLGVTDIIVPNSLPTTSTNTINAYNLLQSNKTYIQAETVAYVNSINQIFDQTKCARDTSLIVDAIAQDLLFSTSSQSTFAGLQYWNQTSTDSIIPNEQTTTTNAINWVRDIAKKIVINDLSGIRYSTGTQETNLVEAGTIAESTIIGNRFDLIVQIINSGTAGVTDLIVPNGLDISPDAEKLYAYNLLQANRTYLQQEGVGYVEANKTLGYQYTTSTCYRDIGYLVDSVSFDLLYGGNRQSIQSGVYYYGFSGTASAIPGESANTIKAYSRLRELLPYVIQGISYPTPSQLVEVQVLSASTGTTAQSTLAQSKVDIITGIINTGTSVVTAKTPISLTRSTSTSVLNAVSLIAANKNFLVAEVLSYISNPENFTYDAAKCYRDVGYMIDCVSFDLLHGGNRQSVQAGVYYYDFNAEATAIPNEIPQTVAAYNHIRNIVGKIVTNQAVTPVSGNTVTQVMLASTATSVEVSSIYEKIDVITGVINNGPSVANNPEPISLTITTNTNAMIAYNLLMANKGFIQADTVAYVNQFDTGFVYNRAKCIRDIGIVVENIAYDVAFGGNEKSRESGLAYWNGVTSYISNEITETTDAFNYLNTLTQYVISNTTAPNLLNDFQTAPQVFNDNLTGGEIAGPIVTKLINIVNDIIAHGPTVAPVRQPGNGPDWGTVSAEVLLQSNRSFIQNEIINWINESYPNFKYKEDRCYRDMGWIIDAVTQDIVLNGNVKTIEAAKTYWTGNKSVLENASYGNKNQVVETLAAINRAKEVSLQVVNNSTVTTTSFTFDPTRCSRDTGLIVDALAQDLLFDGVSQTTFAGIQYWNHGDYVGEIRRELTTTTAAINYVSELAQKIVQNITTGTRYQSSLTQVTTSSFATASEAETIAKNFTTVTDILTYGVAGITDKIIPNSLVPSGNVNVQRAFKLLQDNRSYLQAEAVAFVEATKNFQYDQTKCARDTGLIVDSLVIDLLYPTQYLSQSTFAGLQYWNQNGYTGLIEGELSTTTSAISYVRDLAKKVVRNDLSGSRYTTATQVTTITTGSIADANAVENDFNVIINILSSGTAGVTDIVVPNGIDPVATTSTQYAYDLLQANRTYLINEAVAHVEAIKSVDYEYNAELCARDVGYMLDSVSFDLLHGGNRQAIHSGVYYYNFDSTSTAIPNEIEQAVAAFTFVRTLSSNIAQNITITPLQTEVIQDKSLPPATAGVVEYITRPVDRVINIIQNGPDVVAAKEPINLTKISSADIQKAAAVLDANREFIVAETIAYVNKYLTFQYDQELCARDIGYIVDSVGFDMLYGGNKQSIQSGVYYWGYSESSTSLPKERVASTQAYQYMKTLIGEVVTAQSTGTRYQSTITQTINLQAATDVEVATISSNIDKIITIINEGPQTAGSKEPIKMVASDNRFVRNAVNLLSANRDYIRAEVIAYVHETQVTNDQVFLPFYDMGANATLSIIRNFDLLSNIIEKGPGVAPPETQGNGIFVKTGLSPNDTKVAPIVTSVTTVSTGTYLIEIDQSTVGYGDNQSLYFGETSVFPLLDQYVPDRWSIRRLNPIGSMGGALIDGGVISDRSPINSFVFDAFTQVNQGGNGIKITNNGYAQLVSVFTIFCSNAVTVENGGICSITNSNSNFGDICLTAKGYGRREFSGYIKNPPVLPYFPNGVYPRNGQVNVYVADPLLRPHISLVMEIQPPVGFVNVQGLPGFLSGNVNIDTLTTGTIDIVGVDTSGFCIGQAFYIRDQYGRSVDDNNQPYVRPGTIVADVNYQRITLNYPLNSGGGEVGNTNYFNLYSCGNAYYTVLSSEIGPDPVVPGTLLLPNQQNVQEAVSLDYIYTLTEKIVSNTTITNTLQTTSTQVFDFTQVGGENALPFIRDRLDIISNILVNGTGATPEVTYYGTLPSGSGAAATMLNKNREFLQDEIIKYVDQEFFSYNYDAAKCERDTGLIVDAIAQDLLFKSNSQSVFSAIQYWNHTSYTGKIASEITTTTAAIEYVKDLAQKVVQGIIVASPYQTATTQVTNLALATPAEASTIAAHFTTITNILLDGTAGVTDMIVPNGLNPSGNINIVRAYDLLQANKIYIQEEAVAFVESTKSGFRYNQDKCERDTGLIIDAIALDMAFPTVNSSQATFAGLQYWNNSGYTGLIEGELTTTTNAVNYLSDLSQKIILNATTGTRYQSSLTQFTGLPAASNVEKTKLNSEFTIITTILNSGTSGVTDLIQTGGIIASTSTTVVHAYDLLQANKAYLQAEVVAYVEATKTPGYTYDPAQCYRDAGYMIDSVCFDLLYGGNRQAVQSGVYYYNFNGSTAIPGEATTTTSAFNYLSSIAQQVILGQTVTTRQNKVTQVFSTAIGSLSDANSIIVKVNLINNIINSGPSVVSVKEPISLAKTATTSTVNATNILLANRRFLVAETIAYINQTQGFDYDKDLCYRDVGYMIDAVSMDLLYGGNRQTIQSGVYYFGYNSTSTAIPNEIEQTVAAYNYISSLTEAIIMGSNITGLQTAVPRVTGIGGSIAEANASRELVTQIASIIEKGPDSTIVNVPLPVYASESAEAENTAKMIAANRDFIVAETVAYVDSVNAPGYVYDKTKCARDTGLIVDAIAQDVMFESYSQSIFSGVQYWNHGAYVGEIGNEVSTTTNTINYIKSLIAKVVTNDTSGGRYQSAVSQDTSLTAATSAEGAALGADLDVIKNIINGGISGVTDLIVPNGLTASSTSSVQRAFNILIANKGYIQAEAVAYVEATKNAGFIYNQTKCARDVGYMIDAIAVDLLYGGNRQAVQAGVYYYGYNTSSTALPGEQAQSIDAYNYIKSILASIVKGESLATTYQSDVAQVTSGTPGTDDQVRSAQNRIDIITSIIEKGPTVSAIKQPLSIVRSTEVNVVNSAKLILANRDWIVAEVIAYVNGRYASYNKAKCRRDVGLLVDALVYDLEKGGNYNAVIAGRSYYAEHGTHHIVQLEENVTDPSLFPDGAIVTFYQRSYMSASGYLFEYVGSGVTYGALPQRGVKDPVQSKETVQLNNGKVFFTSTDQNGDFRIGTGLVISQATGVLSGRTFTKSLFANLTPFILAIEGG